MQPQSHASTPVINNSPRQKIEPQTMQRPPDPVPPQRTPQASITPNHNTTNGSLPNGNSVSSAPPSSAGANPSAAPGPIRATTPLVVRQDNNGVQWIAFEYSRDRVKMEYTIRCDVESVNTDTLSPDFKTDNCVYPRACCGKESYKGNRLAYETECNTVGWALAELNTCLRGKRGLIQRAVDSWRNSNANVRLRSRRVRRMAKASSRKSSSAGTTTTTAVPSSVVPGTPAGMPSTPNPMAAPDQRQSSNGMMTHHHGRSDGVASGSPTDMNGKFHSFYRSRLQNLYNFICPRSFRFFTSIFFSRPGTPLHKSSHFLVTPLTCILGVNGTFNPNSQIMKPQSAPPTDAQHRNLFQGYPSYPSAIMGASLPPSLHNGLDHPGHYPTPHTAVAASSSVSNESVSESNLFGDLPASKRRTFFSVDKLRVQTNLQQVKMSEIPDDYRQRNSVYPRSYRPVQMPGDESPSKGNRFSLEDSAPSGAITSEHTVVGKTMVPIPLLEGEEVAVPRIGRAKRDRDDILNVMGHRMSWNQLKLFSDKNVFLQKSCTSSL